MLLSINNVKHVLRAYGMREAYTQGGANILYCGHVAIRLINDYTIEMWDPSETSSGYIQDFDSIEEKNNVILELGLEALGAI